MLFGRSKSRRPNYRLDDLIDHLKNHNQQSAYILLQSLATQPQIQEYFKDLHLYATAQNLHSCHKYESLSDGLYVLLKGEIGYLLNNQLPKRQGHKRSKSYGIKDARSIIINEPLTVFDSSFKNCTAHEETYLLKITPEEADITLFAEWRQRRNQLFQNHYLSQDHYRLYNIPSANRVLHADSNIHSIFHFVKYTFRQIVTLTSPAIVSEGRAKLKVAEFSAHEFDQYGVLLPHLKYEVTSSTLSLMVISNHQSLTYGFDLSLLKSIKNGPRPRKQNQPSKSASLNVLKHEPAMQDSRRKKQLAKVSKQIQNYSIFPAFMCTRKFDSNKSFLISSKALKKKVILHEAGKACGQQFGCITTQNSSRYLNTKQSSSLYQEVSSNSTKYTRFFGKLLASPSEGQLLTKIRDKLRHQQKNRSVFTFAVGQGKVHQNYIGCISQQ